MSNLRHISHPLCLLHLPLLTSSLDIVSHVYLFKIIITVAWFPTFKYKSSRNDRESRGVLVVSSGKTALLWFIQAVVSGCLTWPLHPGYFTILPDLDPSKDSLLFKRQVSCVKVVIFLCQTYQRMLVQRESLSTSRSLVKFRVSSFYLLQEQVMRMVFVLQLHSLIFDLQPKPLIILTTKSTTEY